MSKQLSLFVIFLGLVSSAVGMYRIMPSDFFSVAVMAEKFIATIQIIGGVILIYGGLLYFKRDKGTEDDNLL
ncbi:hypothetical protein LRP52_37070 [Photobacterium sp. ZSDE20]|uniref:Uncharacterized protein n=1 Tax=Photobacterium pectinilyticum TaxID=2906793 RepID=A0ABT1N773_9GAMM|nr:hypothetical protein [Photobacterium sp. ZSDE20]MCQ1060604.1 hypothetical protein [Photobacterium sp. ZSDE20]MDD1827799.1 hypothetical protein [Photobacterium sp. ZSDE20]